MDGRQGVVWPSGKGGSRWWLPVASRYALIGSRVVQPPDCGLCSGRWPPFFLLLSPLLPPYLNISFQGKLKMWIELLTPEEAAANEPYPIKPPTKEPFELRIIVWETKNVVPKDKILGKV